MLSGSLKFVSNGLEDAVHVFKDVIVPKSDDPVAAFLEPSSAGRVFGSAFRRTVLAAIQFDDELLREADEVNDIRSERVLTAELVPKRRAADLMPEAQFSVCEVGSQLFDMFTDHELMLAPFISLFRLRDQSDKAVEEIM